MAAESSPPHPQALLEKAPEGSGKGFHIIGFSPEKCLEDQPQRRDPSGELGTEGILPALPSHLHFPGLKAPSPAPPSFTCLLGSKPYLASIL